MLIAGFVSNGTVAADSFLSMLIAGFVSNGTVAADSFFGVGGLTSAL